jgi:adenylate cyclase
VEEEETRNPLQDTNRNNHSGVRKILLFGVFKRILIIEAILLVWSLGYRFYTEMPPPEELFWYVVRIIILIAIILVFMMVTLRRFLDRKIITPLEAISAANRRLKENDFDDEAVPLDENTPREIEEIVTTRKQMLAAILKVSRERLDLVNFIRDTFGRYLSKKIVDEILESPQARELGGRREIITVLMSDLRGFTGLSETRDPQLIVRLLNRYLERMSKVIHDHDGIIDDFIGDAILAIFGVPETHADDDARAVACALTMQKELQILNDEFVSEGYPPLEMGIGINTGPVVVGNIGSEERMKYGIVGTTVNTASRIESQTIGGQVLVGESTYAQVKDLVGTEAPISVMMKGLKRPLVSYPVVAIGEPYNVSLDPTESDHDIVPVELSFNSWVVNEKEIAPTVIKGETVTLNDQTITAVLSENIPPLTDIKMQFDFCMDVHCFSDIYAKVIDVSESRTSPPIHQLRLTFIEPGDRKILKGWIQQLRPAG